MRKAPVKSLTGLIFLNPGTTLRPGESTLFAYIDGRIHPPEHPAVPSELRAWIGKMRQNEALQHQQHAAADWLSAARHKPELVQRLADAGWTITDAALALAGPHGKQREQAIRAIEACAKPAN